MQIPHRLPHDERELDFIMQVYALWAEDGACVWEEDGGRRFEEEEGLFGFGVVEFFYVVADGEVRGVLTEVWRREERGGSSFKVGLGGWGRRTRSFGLCTLPRELLEGVLEERGKGREAYLAAVCAEGLEGCGHD